MNDQSPTIEMPVAHAATAQSPPIGHDRERVAVRPRLRLVTPLALLALGLLALAFFWPVVLLHEALLPGDVLYIKDPLWQALAPATFSAPANPLDSDTLTEFYPWTALAAEALHHGTIPLWNPYAFAGTPFLAAMQTAVLYPINIILQLTLPAVDVLGARSIVHLALALAGAFLLARRLSCSRLGALVAALAFGLSLPYVVWLEHPMSGAAAWLPWLLLCIDGIVAGCGRLRWALALAAVAALEVLAGHGETTVHVLLLCAAFALFRAGQAWRRDGRFGDALRPLATLVAAFALGGGIAAAHLLPVLAQIPLSEASHDRAVSAIQFLPALAGDPAQWATAATALVPDFFGNPAWHVGLLSIGMGLGYNEAALYAGAIPLLLAVLALTRRRDATTLFFAVAALVALGIALRLPLFNLFNALPVLRVAQNGRLRIEYALAVALLAGRGLDALVGDGIPAARRLLRLWLSCVATATALGAVALLVWGHAAPETIWRIALPLAWLALFAILTRFAGPAHAGLPTPLLRAFTVALVGIDLFTAGSGYHATVPRDLVATPPPAVRAVQRDHSLYRVAGLDAIMAGATRGQALTPSLSSLYGLQDIRGYDPAHDAAYDRYFTYSFEVSSGMRLSLNRFGPSPRAARALDLLNVKYLLLSCAIPLNPRYYQPIYRGAGCVYRNKAVLPRAFIVHRAAPAGPARAARLLGDGSVDPRATVLLDPRTATATAWRGLSAPPPGVHDAASVTSYGLNAVEVRVTSAARGVLVLADAYAPGWYATVDGHARPLARADAILRAVPIPAGTHLVRFVYEPRSWDVGVAISLGALALWLGLALITLTRRPRPR